MRGKILSGIIIGELVVAHAALVGEEEELWFALLAVVADDAVGEDAPLIGVVGVPSDVVLRAVGVGEDSASQETHLGEVLKVPDVDVLLPLEDDGHRQQEGDHHRVGRIGRIKLVPITTVVATVDHSRGKAIPRSHTRNRSDVWQRG